MSNQLLGAFSPYTCKIPNEAKDAFNEAMKNFVGVVYEPIAVSQQVAAGMNYHFFCNTESVTPYPVSGAAIVSIYKPLNEGAIITNIKPIN
jgi:hypothetical protein